MSNPLPRRNFLTRSLVAFASAVAMPAVSFTKSFKKSYPLFYTDKENTLELFKI